MTAYRSAAFTSPVSPGFSPAPALSMPAQPLRFHNHSAARRLLALLLLAIGAYLLAACGPADESGGSLEEQTQAIAREYAAGGNLETARAALQALDVANPNQWLVYMTETAIGDPTVDPEVRRGLVALALAMGSRESTIRDWAQANGLVDAAQATSAVVASTVAAAVQAPVQPAAQPAAAPAAAVSAAATGTAPLAAAAPVTASAPTTGSAAGPTSTPTEAPTATPAQSAAQVSATQLLNLRQGPGIEFGLAGAMNPGDTAAITGKNAAGDWWEIRTAGGAAAWVYGPLVTATGPVESVALAANVPQPPPTATPAPVAVAPVEQPTAAPDAPTAAPAEQPTATPAPAGNPSDQPHFAMTVHRMWSKEENGGCAGQHLLRIIVLDANGAPLDGVLLRGIYTGMELTTGAQGKGPGRVEFDLYGTGEGFVVARNNDGRDASSDRAEGFTTKSLDIPVPTLIEGGYCTSEADCQVFYNSYGCTGHHSWEAVFKRNY